MNPTYSISKTNVECYKVRSSKGYGEWADIVLDSNGNSGRIQIASDYGSWEHFWGSCGCPFKQFLIKLTNDINYAAGKFGEGKWFDHEATMLSLRDQIVEYTDDPVLIEEMLEELEPLEDCTEINTFVHLAWESEKLNKMWDSGPDISYGVNPSFKRFWERLWPTFVAELERESQSIQN